jgi:uncharacterized protein (TIGR02145 family)
MKHSSVFYLWSLAIVSVLLSACERKKVSELVTMEVTEISAFSAKSGGQIVSDGGATVISSGICWTKNGEPTVSDNKTVETSEGDSFASYMTDLESGTPYCVRAYAENSEGVGYGNPVYFTTYPTIPFVSDVSISSITTESAVVEGYFIFGKGLIVVSTGICYSRSPITDFSNSYFPTEVISDTIKLNLKGLQDNTVYYVRLCVIIRLYGTGNYYAVVGNEFSFKTTAIPALPTVVSGAAYSVTSTTADIFCEIINDGGSPIIKQGICFGINSSQPLLDTVFSSECGVGQFFIKLENLNPGGKTYYFRGFATNSVGTGCGDIVVFKTSALLPVLSTKDITPATITSSVGGGNITNSGGATITSRGVCWSTTENPTVYDNKTVDGSGAGIFNSTLEGLTSNIIYYARAYATNSAGTAYGDQKTFTNYFNYPGPEVTDIDGNIYNSVKIGYQIWMAENLKTTRYSDGTNILFVNTTTTWDSIPATTKAYCWYNDDISNKSIYGALYTWEAATKGVKSGNYGPSNVQGVCPTGWHLPNDTEWIWLEKYIGMSEADANDNETGLRGTNEGSKLAGEKELWSDDVLENDSEFAISGFNGLPGGYRDHEGGDSFNLGSSTSWWSAYVAYHPDIQAIRRRLNYNSTSIDRDYSYKNDGLSVRCVKNY